MRKLLLLVFLPVLAFVVGCGSDKTVDKTGRKTAFRQVKKKFNGVNKRAASLFVQDKGSAVERLLPEDFPLRLQWSLPLVGKEIKKLYLPNPKTGLSFILVLTKSNDLIALERSNGKALWWTELGGPINGRPVCSPYSVFVMVNNYLLNLKQHNGAVKWKLELKFPAAPYLSASEIEKGNPLFVIPAMNRIVYGLDSYSTIWPPKRSTGKVSRDEIMLKRYKLRTIWKFPTEGMIEGATGYREGSVYLSDSNRRVYCLNLQLLNNARPDLTWKQITRGSNSSGVVIGGAYALVASRDQNLYCYLRRSGSLVWRYESGLSLVSKPTFVADRLSKQVYVIQRSKDKTLFCLSLQRGKLLWLRKNMTSVVGIDVNDEKVKEEKAGVVLADANGGLEAVQLNNGKTLWALAAGKMKFAAENNSYNSIFAVTMDGKTVFALRRP